MYTLFTNFDPDIESYTCIKMYTCSVFPATVNAFVVVAVSCTILHALFSKSGIWHARYLCYSHNMLNTNKNTPHKFTEHKTCSVNLASICILHFWIVKQIASLPLAHNTMGLSPVPGPGLLPSSDTVMQLWVWEEWLQCQRCHPSETTFNRWAVAAVQETLKIPF